MNVRFVSGNLGKDASVFSIRNGKGFRFSLKTLGRNSEWVDVKIFSTSDKQCEFFEQNLVKGTLVEALGLRCTESHNQKVYRFIEAYDVTVVHSSSRQATPPASRETGTDDHHHGDSEPMDEPEPVSPPVTVPAQSDVRW